MKLVEALLVITILSGCNKKPADIIRQPVKPDTSTTVNVTYLALGDSYTIGESVPSSGNFPNQLVLRLNEGGYKVTTPEIIARTGWTTSELMDAVEARKLTRNFDFVTLLIGVNNQYRGYNINTYRTEFVALLDTALKYAGGDKAHVFVVSIPDYSVTPFATGSDRARIAREIDQYNAIAKEETEKEGISYTDITPISRKAADDRDLIASDGLHPSAKMYAEWVELLVPKVGATLKK